MKNATPSKLISKMVSKKVLKQNAKALEFYDSYKEISDLLDRTNVAMGRKPTFKAETGSTLHFEVNQHGVASTTA